MTIKVYFSFAEGKNEEKKPPTLINYLELIPFIFKTLTVDTVLISIDKIDKMYVNVVCMPKKVIII